LKLDACWEAAMSRHRSCLTIAGLDPSGGAGVLVDVAVFRALGFHPACVVAALTVQDTSRVEKVVGVDPGLVKSQAEAIFKDLDVAAVKVGALWSRENVGAVAELLQAHLDIPRVVDPVMKAKGGEGLLEEEAAAELISKLLPLATSATPNVEEASKLTGLEVKSAGDVEEALRSLRRIGVEVPVIKGWVRGGKVVDAVLFEGRVLFLEGVGVGEVKGSGCAFSSALAAYLARGLKPLEAVCEARRFTLEAMRAGLKVGGGFRVVNPAAQLG
jgi:hydroxymethylpyrimidine kinase/phosphomethylpyrimidine kinase